MKSYFTSIAVAALLVIGPTFPGYTEDAATPAAPQAESPPSVPRPSLVPKAAEPTTTPAAGKTAEPDTGNVSDERPRHRRYAHHYRHYRTAYWEPFPIFWPHVYRSRVYWNRIPWAFRF